MRLLALKAGSWAAFLILALSGTPLLASEVSYYAVFFALQSRNWHSPYDGHTFATFIEVLKEEDAFYLKLFTISWLARDGNVHLFPIAQEGKNFSLQETLEIAAAKDLKLFYWGPYQIQPELYDRAASQLDRLRRGEVKYKVIDRFSRRKGTALSCYQAVADIDSDHDFLYGGLLYGAALTELVVEHLSHWFIEPQVTHEWLLELLGIPRNCFQ